CTARHEPDSKFRWKLPNYREINHTINPTELRRLYQGRLHMFDISSGNFSLLISDLTEEDEGLYSCWSDENQHKNFSLTVKGCTLSETEREPETKYTGDSVLLSCSCEDPNTKPEDFRWTHVESSGTEVSSETPRYKDRVHTFHKTTPSNLSLLISNLTEDDQGTYRCTVNHKTSADTRLIVKGELLFTVNITKEIHDCELLFCFVLYVCVFSDSAVINALDYQYYLIFLVFLLCLMLLLAAGCIFWRSTRGTNTHTVDCENHQLCFRLH
uniref:Ig-like domain-containing protein n=1 Tax=Cyprinus carpio TaxID=7962 RepID=A0A8C2J897_CYPCA